MTDPRPRPRYGEYADVPPAPPAPVQLPAADPLPEAAVRPRRTWDLVLTTALLLWGVADVVTGFAQFSRLSVVLSAAFETQGMPAFGSAAAADELGSALNIVRVVLLVVAIAGSLLLLARNRVAFWVPLGAGVLAALVVSVAVFALVVTDPTFAQYVSEQTGR